MSILHNPGGRRRVNSAAFVIRAMRWTPAQRQKVINALAKLNLF